MKPSATCVLAFTCLLACLFLEINTGYAKDRKPAQDFYEIRIYHFKTAAQEKTMDDYLQHALLPALHKNGIGKTGVFKSLANDTAADKLLYVLVPLQSVEQLLLLPARLEKDAEYTTAASGYLHAAYNDPPYTRMESLLLKAFRLAPSMQLPALSGPRSERVYELRSYESPTEMLYINKVHMFNEGGEIPLFRRLDFNAVFYADVISGSHMPNLMYMTSFNDMASREAHWKAFNNDAEWKKLVAMPEYQHNVSKADIFFLRPTDYSDF